MTEKINILLIEDVLAEATLVEEMLVDDETASFEVIHASRLSSGLERLAVDDIDVILLDLYLPDSQGLETCAQMMDQAPALPIIVLSNLDDRALAVEAVRQGAQDYLVKDRLSSDLLTRAIKYAIERKQIEEALRRRTKELTNRNKELDAFADTVAHDLKNPLSLALGFAELLHADHEKMSDEEIGDLTKKIVRFGNKVDAILDELLLLARAREAEVKTRSLDMGSIVAEALERMGQVIEEVEAEIILPETWPVVIGYAPWVEEVWVNYINNALKYGGERPRVEVGADVGQGADVPQGMARFWVRDDGPGIAPEDQARLFTPFERLGHVRAEGHGLGLSIVERIVKRLNGRVSVKSQPGHGSTFYFTLPLSSEGATPSAPR